MAIKINKKPLIIISVVLVAVLGFYKVSQMAHKTKEAQHIDQVSLSAFSEDNKTVSNKFKIPDLDNPVTSPFTGFTTPRTNVVFQIMAWNAQFALMYANGGIKTSKNSLFDSANLMVEIKRQDNCSQTIKDFTANQAQLKSGGTKTPMVIALMGDGIPGYSNGLNPSNKKKDIRSAKVFYFMGRSNGEDAFWGPASWKLHPKEALGKCVAFVEKDGDGNIVLQWAAMNDIPVNPCPHVGKAKYDSNALNIISMVDYNMGNATDGPGLVPKVLSNYTEEREVTSHGHTVPGLTHTCTIDAWSSWTPADVTIAEKKGGYTKLASTKEFTSQMPCALIIDSTWAVNNRKTVETLILQLGKAGDQVKSFSEAQEFAAQVSAKVYAEKDAGFWLTYYRGVSKNDFKGNPVQLGGSSVFNLADAANMFGLGKDGVDKYKITYETFGNILVKLYPEDMKGWTGYDEMIDKSFLTNVLQGNQSLANEKTEDDNTQYASSNIVTNQVGSKAYNIQFAKGQSTILPVSFPLLKNIYDNAMIAKSQSIFSIGHTDNSGSDEINIPLSLARAEAVKSYLVNILHLPSDRIQTKGVGSGSPIEDKNGPLSPANAANRCVEIKFGN